MKIHEIIRPKNYFQLNEVIEFDEHQHLVEVLTDAAAIKVHRIYYFLLEKSNGVTKHPKIVFDADKIEDLLFEVSHYYEDFKHRLTNCYQSIHMLTELHYYLDSYYF
jgi:hypothetical protein